MDRTIFLAGLTLALLPSALGAQSAPAGAVGWYNGDCVYPTDGWNDYYLSDAQFTRIWDDFLVPAGGWTVTSVFSNNLLSVNPSQVTQVSWVIASGLAPGSPGETVVASGVNPVTPISTTHGTYVTYHFEVDGLQVKLAAGTYWLSVAPVVGNKQSFACETSEALAVGVAPGTSHAALFNGPGSSFEAANQSGTDVLTGDYSLGVLITPGSLGPLPSPTQQWQDDIGYLQQQMPLLHSVPYPGISLDDFNAAASALSAGAGTLDDPHIRTGLQALVASIGDPHTDVEWPSSTPFHYLPLSFYWFDDGIYITAAPAQYQDLLGGKMVSIGQSAIADAVQALSALVAHDNDSWLKYWMMANRIRNTDFLFGTGIAPSTNDAQIMVQTASSDTISEDVKAGSSSPMIPVYQGALPLYMQHPEKHYWATTIDSSATVYFQYNACTEDPQQSSADFLAQLNAMLGQTGVQRLIVDMRNNTGGSGSILDPWITQIAKTQFNSPGALYVIIGRATFSAAEEASDFFREQTAAIFVGEDTGGKPRFLLRQGDFPLPYYGIGVSYSSGVENAPDYLPTLVPDIQTGLTFAQYMAGDDPAMDAIEQIPLGEDPFDAIRRE